MCDLFDTSRQLYHVEVLWSTLSCCLCQQMSTEWSDPLCPSCHVPLTVLEVLHEDWKEDPEFVQHVKDDWKNNPIWYGICYDNEHGLEGFWGELRDPYEPNRKTLYFLGQTKSLAIGRMKTCISFS